MNSTTELPIQPKKPAFGKEMKKEFPLSPEWTNLNHGSYGTFPTAILKKLRDYQTQCEAAPDAFIRYTYPLLLDQSRAAVASVINAPTSTVVFIPNATTGVNTIFRNIVWNDDGKDVIVTFSTGYAACSKAADYVVDYHKGKVERREITLEYPMEDDEILRLFTQAVEEIEKDGKRARIAMFDCVTSCPGVVFPWERLTALCRSLDILSFVDGAQGIGMVSIDVAAADPDFFLSNCHKWLYTPRGCAVLYVPERNHELLPTTLATGHGYKPQSVAKMIPEVSSKKVVPRPAPPVSKNQSAFVSSFAFVGTVDNSPYICVKDAIEWRKEHLGGEESIYSHLWALNKEGSDVLAEALQTKVMENKAQSLRNCGMANVALPIWIEEKGEDAKQGDAVLSVEEMPSAVKWILETMVTEYKTFMMVYAHGGRLWVRISTQVYVDLDDIRWAGKVLKELCERVAKKEYL